MQREEKKRKKKRGEAEERRERRGEEEKRKRGSEEARKRRQMEERGRREEEREKREEDQKKKGEEIIRSTIFEGFDFCCCSANPPGVNQVDGLPPVPIVKMVVVQSVPYLSHRHNRCLLCSRDPSNNTNKYVFIGNFT